MEIYNEQELSLAADKLLQFAGDKKIILFYGELGAGKTTFIKAVCRHLGVAGTVSSPTFSLINEYEGNNKLVYHFDFYRLKDEVDALDFGCEEYFASGNYCFIEWPEKVPHLLPPGCVEVHIRTAGSNHNARVIEVRLSNHK